MFKFKDLQNILIGIILVFLFSGGAWAQQAKPLAGRELLKLIRELQGRFAKPAYENRIQQTEQKQEVVETAAEPTETTAAKEEPVITKEAEIKTGEETAAEEGIVTEEVVPEEAMEPTIVTEVTAAIEPEAATAVDEVLSMIPADSLYVVRANSFESSFSRLDEFLAGALPMPFGPSMLIRSNLIKLLGSADLKGVDMSGSFAVFAVQTKVPPTAEGIPTIPSTFILVPVTDYTMFISGNANVSEPDSEGISKITSEGTPALLVRQFGRYALIGLDQFSEDFIETARAITDKSSTSIAGNLEAEQINKAMAEPLWVFVNTQAVPENLDEKLSQQMASAAMMSGGVVPGGGEIDIGTKLKELRFISIAANPKPNVLNINLAIAAMEGSEAAGEFAADSPATLEFIELTGAKRPSETGAEMARITELIPTAQGADLVGTYNLMKLLEAASAMREMGEKPTIPQAQSSLAFAIKFDKDKLMADIALPKEHLIEFVMTAMTQFVPQVPQQEEPGF